MLFIKLGLPILYQRYFLEHFSNFSRVIPSLCYGKKNYLRPSIAVKDVVLSVVVSALLASEFDQVLSDPLSDLWVPISLCGDSCHYCLVVEFYQYKLEIDRVVGFSPVATRAVQFCLGGICI